VSSVNSLVAAFVASSPAPLRPALDAMAELGPRLTTLLLAAAMFGLGTGIVARHLWPVPPRVLLLATVATLVAAGVALALVTLLDI
jgi:uncharacterized membrane protein YadS